MPPSTSNTFAMRVRVLFYSFLVGLSVTLVVTQIFEKGRPKRLIMKRFLVNESCALFESSLP